eukprot:11219394-Lingulodinium_polyedra.AAC.1
MCRVRSLCPRKVCREKSSRGSDREPRSFEALGSVWHRARALFSANVIDFHKFAVVVVVRESIGRMLVRVHRA